MLQLATCRKQILKRSARLVVEFPASRVVPARPRVEFPRVLRMAPLRELLRRRAAGQDRGTCYRVRLLRTVVSQQELGETLRLSGQAGRRPAMVRLAKPNVRWHRRVPSARRGAHRGTWGVTVSPNGSEARART